MKTLIRQTALILCLLLASFACSAAHAESLRYERTTVRFQVPEGWQYVASATAAQAATQLNIPYQDIALLLTDKSDVLLLYPHEEQFDLQHYVKLSFAPMESYHKNFTTLTDDQLGNIGKSYLRGDAYDQWALYRTKAGLIFLKLSPIGRDGITYTTNENDIWPTIEVHGLPSSEAEQALHTFLDSFTLDAPGIDWSEWFSKYGTFVVIPATTLLTLLWMEHKKHKAKA